MTTDDGIVGVGYTSARHPPSASFINEYFAPRLIGESALAPEKVWAQLFQEHLLIGRRGFLLRALSALDIAIWDVVGKVADQPLYRLLGGFRATPSRPTPPAVITAPATRWRTLSRSLPAT